MKKSFLRPALAAALLFSPFSASAEDLDYDRAVSAEALRSDFAALYAGLQSAHFDLYVHRPRDDYDALYERMAEDLTAPMSLFDASVRFQEFAAFGNVAHARIDFPGKVYSAYRESGGLAFPIYLRIVDGRAYVGEDYSGVKGLKAGDEIMSIDSRPISDWLAETARHISADTPYIAHSLLEFQFPMYLWLEAGERERFNIEVTSGNRLRRFTVPAKSADEIGAAAKNGESYFSLDSQSRDARMIGERTAYLRPGPFYNFEDPANAWRNTAFKTFIDGAFESFIAQEAESLIIDLRENPGGDNSFSDLMVSWFADEPFRFASAFLVKSSPEARASNQARLDGDPGAAKGVSGLFAKKYDATPDGGVFAFEIPFAQPRDGARFDGAVYVLVNRHSYSNAVSVAAMVQDYGFGEILGEKTSDMATTYGAMETFKLPNTLLEIGFPKAHIVRPSGDPVSDGVTPDRPIMTPIAPSRTDVVLENAQRLIEGE